MFSRTDLLLLLVLGGALAPSVAGQVRIDHEPIPGFPWVELHALPPIDLLEADGPPAQIRGIRDFCLLDEHRLAILRDDQTLLVVTDRGEVLREQHLPRFRSTVGLLRLHLDALDLIRCTAPDRVVLAPDRVWEEGARQPGCLLEVDLATGALRIPALLPSISGRLALSDSGGFAVLTDLGTDHRELHVFGADGSLTWSRKKRVCSGWNLEFTRDDRVALFDAQQDSVQLFRWHGWWSSYTRLGLRSGVRYGGYGMQCSSGGGFLLLYSTEMGVELVRADEDFRPVQVLEPRHAEGTPIASSFRLSASGRLWACDRYSISRLGADGTPEITLGVPPQEHRLEGASHVEIDREDRIFAIAERDDAVHEFDRTGKRVRVVARPSGTPPSRDRDFVPKGFEEVFGSRLPARFGQRNRCRYAGPSAVGAVALLPETRQETPGDVVILDAEANERTRWQMPELSDWLESGDLDGRCLVIALPDQLLAWRADGSPWFRAAIPYSCSHMGCGMMPSLCWLVHLTQDGHELWLRRGPEATTVERYALP